MLDPLGALADFVLGKMKQSALKLWAQLIFTMAFSAVVSFLFICGGCLAAGGAAGVAIGLGMVMGACAMTYLYRRSALTRGMMVVLPAAEATKEMDSDFQVIQKS